MHATAGMTWRMLGFSMRRKNTADGRFLYDWRNPARGQDCLVRLSRHRSNLPQMVIHAWRKSRIRSLSSLENHSDMRNTLISHPEPLLPREEKPGRGASPTVIRREKDLLVECRPATGDHKARKRGDLRSRAQIELRRGRQLRARPKIVLRADESAPFVDPHSERLTRQGPCLSMEDCALPGSRLRSHHIRFGIHCRYPARRWRGCPVCSTGHVNRSTTQKHTGLVEALDAGQPQ
jgi:hypothetical protein